MIERNVEGLGWDPTQLGEGGLLTYLYISPVEMNVDDVMERIVDVIGAKGIRRLVVDSLGDVQATSPDEGRFRSYVYSMIQLVAAVGITTYVTLESYAEPVAEHLGISQISYLCDNVLSLRYREVDGEVRRSLSVIKTRGSGHDPRVRAFTIGDRGIEVEEGRPIRRGADRRPRDERQGGGDDR